MNPIGDKKKGRPKNSKNKRKCEDCGTSTGSIKDTICPYAKEINCEEISVRLCESCLHERAMDI